METVQFMIINVILPLIVGGIGAYIYPRLESYLKNRTLSLRQRKIKAILNEYKLVKIYSVNVSLLNLISLRDIARGLSQIVILILFIGVGLLMLPAFERALILIASAVISFQAGLVFQTFKNIFDTINNLLHFDKFREETIAKLKKLGGNPEDLDKEESKE